MNSTITKISKWFLITFLAIYSIDSQAGHLLGTRIMYTYVSANTYLVTVDLYRDCLGIPGGQQKMLCYSSVSGNTSASTPLQLQSPPYYLPNFPYLPPVITTCNGGNGFGIERMTYQGTLVLPSQHTDWVLSFSSFPENIGSSQNFLYVSTKIDNVNYPINSSSNYTFDPTFIFCLNQPAWDNFISTDADGDSLSYHLIPILDNTTACPHAPYQSPIPPFSPLQSSTPIAMDSTNGSLTFTPTLVGNAMISARVDEFRNGVLINSSTVEQVMYIIPNCVVSGLNELADPLLNIYPNPVSETLTVELKGNLIPIYAEVTDLSGKVLKLKLKSSANGTYLIDVKMLSKGMYTLRVISENETVVEIFVKQ